MNVYDPPCSVLDAEQLTFLMLHARDDAPVKWQWVFCETSLRAFTEHGHTAIITRARLNELIGAGLMNPGIGCADVSITYAGRQAVRK